MLKSIDLYLDYPAKEIVTTKVIQDVGCGIYPCYYVKKDKMLLVSTSVVALIEHLGDFKENKRFKPRDFYNHPPISENRRRLKNIFANNEKNAWLKRKTLNSIHFLLKQTGNLIQFDLIDYLFGEYYFKEPDWYYTINTVDLRIKKLKAFEKVDITRSQNQFQPESIYVDKDFIINQTAKYLTDFLQSIESKYPKHQHVVLTAGKDSQLIWLVPKINKKNWHCFTSQPNVSIVKNWLHSNNIDYNQFFEHEDYNNDSLEDLKLKTICGDLYSDVTHLRWMPKMKEIAEKFDNKVIFWGGTAADAIFKFYPQFHKDNYTFYKLHKERVASFQGNYHQVFKNFTGCAYLSPYHSKEIWKELFLKMNPLFIEPYLDVRKELGHILAKKQVTWIDDNPAPKPYSYNYEFNPISYYKSRITNLK